MPLAFEAFSQPWADAWATALNSSEAYRTAAAKWEGPVALVLDEGPEAPGRAVILDLWHGSCRSARAGGLNDLEDATYVFQADRQGWREVLVGGSSPVLALMTGKIRLTRGSLSAMLPFARAAKELLELAGEVPTEFPEG